MAMARSKSRAATMFATANPCYGRSIFARTESGDFVPMHPNAVHDAKREHDHERKRAAVADQRQRNAGNRQDRYSHPHVLENVSEDQRRDANYQKQTKLVARKKGDEETGQEQQAECSDEKHSTDKAPLLADGGKNVVVVNCRGRQEPELDLRVGRFKSFSGPSTGTDGY